MFWPKKYFSVMRSLQSHISMFSESSHVILTLENVENIVIITKPGQKSQQKLGIQNAKLLMKPSVQFSGRKSLRSFESEPSGE